MCAARAISAIKRCRNLAETTTSIAGLDLIATGIDEMTLWCKDSDAVRVAISVAFDAIAGREECIEALDQSRVSSKELRDSSNYAWCINAVVYFSKIV